jgi:hypothetical protein
MRKTKFETALPRIKAFFANSPSKVWRRTELGWTLERLRAEWGLPRTLSLKDFLVRLLEASALRQNRLEFPHRTETLYSWDAIEPHELAVALNPKGYLTHYSAMALHELTDQIPRTVYVNVEQPAKPQSGQTLEQKAIDAGFRHKPRVSANMAQYGEYRICLLNGMHTGGLGVSSMMSVNERVLRVTDLERTLIDIAVRPFYAGGVYEVLEAYRRARGLVDVPQLTKMYGRLGYVYPYHQAIGFYMERAGYSHQEIESMRKFEMKYNFYLTHQMRSPEFSASWKLYFPKGF